MIRKLKLFNSIEKGGHSNPFVNMRGSVSKKTSFYGAKSDRKHFLESIGIEDDDTMDRLRDRRCKRENG